MGSSARIGMRGAALALAALLLAGCGAGPSGGEPAVPAEPTEVPLPEGVTVEFMQLRSDVAKRAAQVRVVNGSDETLQITRLAFEDDWFDGPAVRDRPAEIAAGRTLDLTIQLPPSACEGEVEAAGRTSRVVLDYSSGDGSSRSTADLPDPLDVIPALHARECLLSDLEDSTGLAFTAFEPSEAGQAATLTLTLTPTGRAASEILGIRSTNLLALGQVGRHGRPLSAGGGRRRGRDGPDRRRASARSVPVRPPRGPGGQARHDLHPRRHHRRSDGRRQPRCSRGHQGGPARLGRRLVRLRGIGQGAAGELAIIEAAPRGPWARSRARRSRRRRASR